MEQRKITTKLRENATNNYANIMRMIDMFEKIKPSQALVDMRTNMIDAKKIIGASIITDYTSEYVLRFEDEIMKENVQTLLNYDYTKLVEEGTIDKTRDMIHELISLVKDVWINGDDKIREQVKLHIFMLLRYSVVHRELKNKL